MYYRPVQCIDYPPISIQVQFSPDEVLEHRLRRVLTPWAARMFVNFQMLDGLYRDDQIVLLHRLVCVESQEKLWPPGETIHASDMERCLQFSAWVVLDVLFPRGLPGFGVVAFKNAVEDWLPFVHAARNRARLGVGDRRDMAIDYVMTETWRRYGPRRDIDQFFRVARTRSLETGVLACKLDCTPSTLNEILAFYKRSTAGAPGGLYRAANGDIQLSPTEFRDFLCSRLAGKRAPRITRRTTTPSPALFRPKVEAHEVPEDIADPRPITSDVVGTADALRRVREVLERRDQRLNRGSVKRRTLRYVLPYLNGDLSVPKIASAIGASPSAVHNALVSHKQAILEAVKIS